jgi:hypothetical protein
MARYQATVASQSPAAETFGYLAAFSNAAEWDPGVLAGNTSITGRSGPAAGSGSWCRLRGRGCP